MLSKKELLMAIGLMALPCAQGQVLVYEDYVPEKQLIYTKENKFSGFIHTSGFGLGFEKGRYNIRSRYSGWSIEATNMKHSKAAKTEPFGAMLGSNARRYSFGKINSVLICRGGYDRSITLNEKPYWGGVNLAFDYSFGVSLALAFPQYLSIIYIDQDPVTGEEIVRTENEKYDPNKPNHQAWDQIYGKAPLFYHFWEVKPYPGFFLKSGMNFEFGSDEKKISSVEIGIVLDFYMAKIPMIAHNPYRNYFFNFYLSYQFGKRYGTR